MCSVVQLSPPPIGYVGVELGRGEVGVAEHLLDTPEVGAPLEQVRCERVAKQVRMDAPGLEAGLLRQLAQDQERAGTGERADPRVQEKLGQMQGDEEGP